MTDPIQEDAPDPPAKRRPRRASRMLTGALNLCLAVLTVGVLGLAALTLYLKSNPLTAPEWAKKMIETRLAEAAPQAQVRFSEVAVLVDDGWVPQLMLRDVTVLRPGGQALAQFNEVQASFVPGALINRQIRPRRIALTGVVARLQRMADGSLSLRADARGQSERRAASLAEISARVDAVLELPVLSALEQVDIRAVTLQYDDLRAERSWTVDGARAQLNREDGDISIRADLALLSGGAGVATVSANYASRIGETAAQVGIVFEDVAAGDIAAQGPAFEWLGVLNAAISGSVRTGLGTDGTLTPISASLQIGAGAVQPDPAAPPVPFDSAQSYFSFDPATNVLTFDLLSVRSAWVSADAGGVAALSIDPETGRLDDLVGQVTLNEIAANPAGLYDAAIAISAAEADFRLRLDPFELSIGRAQITDQRRVLNLGGKVGVQPAGWSVAVDGDLESIALDRLLALWPTRAVPKTRAWLVKNLRGGEVSNVTLALRRKPDTAPQTFVAFDYTGADVRYLDTLPPIRAARGHFSLGANRLVIAVEEGEVTPPGGGPITVTGSSFIIPDVTAKDGAPAVVRLQTRSEIAAVLSLLNMPPLSAMDKANLPVELAEGEAALEATLAFRMKRGAGPGLRYHGSGQLLSLRSDVLIDDRRLEAEALTITADNTGLSISGAGALDGVPFDARFTQPLGPGAGPGRVSGDLEVTAAGLETFGVRLPPGSLSGRGDARINITLERGTPPAFDLTSDLVGLAVNVPQVSWSKPAGRPGALQVAGRLGPTPQIDRLDIAGPGLEASGRVRFGANSTLERVEFDTVEVGNWLNVPLDLIGQGAGRPLKVALRGGLLDLRRAAFGEGASPSDAPPLDLALDRLQVTDTIALTGMRGEFDLTQGLDGSFRAALNGGARLEGRVVPQEGRSAVRLTSANAGDVLRAAGLLEQVQGGQLQLLLLPVGSGGAFDGRLTVQGVTIRDAPGIAALLNAVSIVGLVNELNGDGIYFDEVEARFRLTPDQLTLTEASAVGASMGISMDGTYALDSKQLAMQGVISPVYLLNGIGSLFTRRGEGLIGFNYTLNGPAQTPKVAVNPLSALTPAMFREIFRAPPPELPEVDGVTESTLPEAPAPTRRPVARQPEGR